MPEAAALTHDGEGVEGVDKGEGEVPECIVYVDIFGVSVVGPAAAAGDGVEFVEGKGVVEVGAVGEEEGLAGLLAEREYGGRVALRRTGRRGGGGCGRGEKKEWQ